jgi:uncharacterized protein YutE (UPF0331/DUF86 family)
MSLRREVIEERLAKIREIVTLLSQLQGLTGDELQTDPFRLYTVERGLQVAIECVLDIGTHVISAYGFRKPSEYAEVFDVLWENKVLPQEFAERIRPMAGLRNLLVHMYLDVNSHRLAEHLDRLDDFRAFSEYILDYVGR